MEKSSSLTMGKEQDKKKIKKLLGDRARLDGLTNLLEDSLDSEPGNKEFYFVVADFVGKLHGLESSISIKLKTLSHLKITVACVDKLDERLIRLLALQRLQQLSGASPLSDCLPLSNKTQSLMVQRQPTFWPAPETGLKPRALLTPLNGCQPPMPIYYRVMEIGTGGDMDICLTYYGHCNYVTAKHAVIICDEVSFGFLCKREGNKS